jgi:DNA ligase-associated metallophosphoesterase
MPIQNLSPHQAFVAENVILDGRLAVFDQSERWLAVADLHFGYELSQRAAGSLVPLWGMDSVRERLLDLLRDYEPERLVIVGDLVHDNTAAEEARRLIEELAQRCAVTLIAGNHDRKLPPSVQRIDSWETERFHFHHGHCGSAETDLIQIIGHHHPAGTVTDGAGLRLKLPAFVQQRNCWILPAFSPWAAGATWRSDEESCVWLCSPARVLRLGGDSQLDAEARTATARRR